MKKGRVFVDFLRDIHEAAEAVEEFLTSIPSAKEFREDRKTVFAVIRAFEIMGEASKNIPAQFRRKHPQVPWREMAGMRDKVIHDYFGVDNDVLWKTATEDVPGVKEAIGKILADWEQGELL